MSKLGVPMMATEFIRSEARQNDLYALGNSRARGGQSPHQYGLAVDVVHAKHGWQIDKKAWALIGHVGKEAARQAGLHIEWGGDFGTIWDPAHWQLEGWKDLKGGYPWKG